MFGGDTLEYGSRRVGRAIVDDDDFEFRILLCEQGADAGLYLPLFIARRNDDR